MLSSGGPCKHGSEWPLLPCDWDKEEIRPALSASPFHCEHYVPRGLRTRREIDSSKTEKGASHPLPSQCHSSLQTSTLRQGPTSQVMLTFTVYLVFKHSCPLTIQKLTCNRFGVQGCTRVCSHACNVPTYHVETKGHCHASSRRLFLLTT